MKRLFALTLAALFTTNALGTEKPLTPEHLQKAMFGHLQVSTNRSSRPNSNRLSTPEGVNLILNSATARHNAILQKRRTQQSPLQNKHKRQNHNAQMRGNKHGNYRNSDQRHRSPKK